MSEPITDLETAVRVLGALPVPVGPVPVPLTEQLIEALAAAGNRAVNDQVHDDLCACDAWPEKCLSSGGFFQGYWDMGGMETAIPAVIVLWESMRGGELERLRKQVAELLAERHSTNEALADTTVAQRAAETSADRLARLLAPTQAGGAQ